MANGRRRQGGKRSDELGVGYSSGGMLSLLRRMVARRHPRVLVMERDGRLIDARRARASEGVDR